MLYYGRYVRNEAFVALFGVVTLWAILRFLETGENKFLYWLTGATLLHFTTKETSFIYTAQALIFLGLVFIWDLLKEGWEKPRYKRIFFSIFIVALLFLGIGILAGMAAGAVIGGLVGLIFGSNLDYFVE